MKESPDRQRLEELLRSSALVAGGFMGSDIRSFSEVIDTDLAELSSLGYTKEQLAQQMRQITKLAIPGLGTWVRIDDSNEARVQEAKGSLVCPWPHPGQFAKRVTIVRSTATGQTMKWSDLNIHLIAEHGFFEGRGSAFRIEPTEITKIVF